VERFLTGRPKSLIGGSNLSDWEWLSTVLSRGAIMSRLRRPIRCLLWLSFAAIFCFLGFLTYKEVCGTASISFGAEDLAKIGDDMTEDEVAEVLGLPAGDYCTDEQISRTFYIYYIDSPLPNLPHREWLSDQGMIQIVFKNGKVMSKRFYPAILPRRSWFEQVRNRLGL
jgi:hypothetical protein